ncbi:GNAT family N-acetyltransferase [Alkalicoccus urumqiensis]|uniref:GNAT family N-acetyltransferase n=1 Tax=Alkalicoccus urumqiensis TaxID=1548213 RepID=UPI0015E5CACF|nr:GNAT family N-acetyltransferase [Alkalicoccus urumqiensis]
MKYIPVQLEKHEAVLTAFRRQALEESFGRSSHFQPETYLEWLAQKKRHFPEGFVLVQENDVFIGQLELAVSVYEQNMIGYVHLLYVIPEKRGTGTGRDMLQYAERLFLSHGLREYHLRVSLTNEAARGFYLHTGMEEIGVEENGTVMRMRKYL